MDIGIDVLNFAYPVFQRREDNFYAIVVQVSFSFSPRYYLFFPLPR